MIERITGLRMVPDAATISHTPAQRDGQRVCQTRGLTTKADSR